MQKTANYQDLIKLIAIILMVIDHLGLYIFPEMHFFRAIGRYSMPIFCFFAGYNLKNKARIEILVYGLALYAISVFLVFGKFVETNILVPIFLGQVYLILFQKQLDNFFIVCIHFIILAVLWSWTYFIFDYGTLVIAVMLLGFVARQKPQILPLTAAVASFVSIIHTHIIFKDFALIYAIISTFVAISVYFSLTTIDYNRSISINITPITRKIALIYFMHLTIIELIWRYYIIS